jgi:hypothetical protein
VKTGLAATLLGLTLWTQAFAAPSVAQMAVTGEGGFHLTLVCDAEPVQTIALETRESPDAPWRNVAIWDARPNWQPGTSHDFSAPGTPDQLDNDQYRVLFFGQKGLLKLETLTPEPDAEQLETIG